MKIFILVGLIILQGCNYSQRVQSLSDTELCENLGYYSLYKHTEGISLTQAEINFRSINKNNCEGIANAKIDQITPKYKVQLCQNLVAYHVKGAYEHFKITLDKIKNLNFADEECYTIAEFYLIRLNRKKEKMQALFGKGTLFNPFHVKLQ